MNNFLEASKIKLRIETAQGSLSVEQLWDLSLSKISDAIKHAKKELKKGDNDDDLSFLDETKTVDVEAQLRFDILKEIYLYKRDEAKEAREKADNKANNEKILAIIKQKQEGALQEKSIDELMAMLK